MGGGLKRRVTRPESKMNDLLDYLFDGKKNALYPAVEGWIKGSRRFKAFATSYRSKIRAKVKGVRDDGGMKDLHAELETAVVLLREERFSLEYEKYAASKQRGPDFTVTFKTHTPFNVEVRRIRTDEDAAGKLLAAICDKVRQMPPSIINLLWLVVEDPISEDDLTRAVLTLRQLAEQKTEDFFARRGFESAASFLKQYQRLSGIILHQSDKNVLWLNPLARHKVLPDMVKALHRLETS